MAKQAVKRLELATPDLNGGEADEVSEAQKRFPVLKFTAMQMDVYIEGQAPGLLTCRMDPEMVRNAPTAEQYKDRAFMIERAYQLRYLCVDGTDGFIAAAFKQSMARAAHRFYGIQLVRAFGMIRIPADRLPLDIPAAPEIREDGAVNRFKKDAAIVSYRPWYPEWRVTLPVIFWADRIEFTQVIDLLRIAGQSVGVGAWRAERGGNFGCFRVTGSSQPSVYDRWEHRQ